MSGLVLLESLRIVTPKGCALDGIPLWIQICCRGMLGDVWDVCREVSAVIVGKQGG